jgi:hypothetical protein
MTNNEYFLVATDASTLPTESNKASFMYNGAQDTSL